MTLGECLDYLRYNAPEMGRLRARGDKLSARIYAAYQHCYDHRTDVKAQDNLIALIEEYAKRDLNESEAAMLHNKLGHKNAEDPITWPELQSKQLIGSAVHHALRRRH